MTIKIMVVNLDEWVEGKLLPNNEEQALKIITDFFNKHHYVAIDFFKHRYPFITTIAHVMRKGGAYFSIDDGDLVFVDVDPDEKNVFVNVTKYTPDIFRRIIKAYIYQDFE